MSWKCDRIFGWDGAVELSSAWMVGKLGLGRIREDETSIFRRILIISRFGSNSLKDQPRDVHKSNNEFLSSKDLLPRRRQKHVQYSSRDPLELHSLPQAHNLSILKHINISAENRFIVW